MRLLAPARFDGQHNDGERHGEGTLTLCDGITLGGVWTRGELRGQGTITYVDGSSCTLALEAARPLPGAPELRVRAAAFLDECEFRYPNGDVYEGEFAQLGCGGGEIAPSDGVPAAKLLIWRRAFGRLHGHGASRKI